MKRWLTPMVAALSFAVAFAIAGVTTTTAALLDADDNPNNVIASAVRLNIVPPECEPHVGWHLRHRGDKWSDGGNCHKHCDWDDAGLLASNEDDPLFDGTALAQVPDGVDHTSPAPAERDGAKPPGETTGGGEDSAQQETEHLQPTDDEVPSDGAVPVAGGDQQEEDLGAGTGIELTEGEPSKVDADD